MKNILCYGFYDHKNLGDELFKDAFNKLFPNYNFYFVNHLTLYNLKFSDTIFFGGGSFLDQDIIIIGNNDEIYNEIIKKNILYIGIGLETKIHKNHENLMNLAKLIAYRDNINNLNYKFDNLLEIPDLVYSLNKNENFIKQNLNTVLMLPNVSVVPKHNDSHWKHSAWEHFKIEMAQFLDYLIDNKYIVKFGNMCQDSKLNDNFATYGILSSMINRDNNFVYNYINQEIISSFEMVITQRYHGIILSKISNVANLPIHHHDKLKTDNSISYYEVSKDKLINNFYFNKNNFVKNINEKVNFNAFDQLVKKVKNIIKD